MKHKTPFSHPVGRLLVSILVFGSIAGCSQHDASDDKPDPKLVDAVIEQLQDSGKLDTAVKNSIRHLLEERRQADAKAAKTHKQRLIEKAREMPAPDIHDEHVFGNPDAMVSMIEYADFECPFCKRFHGTPQQVQKQFGDKVNLIYRSMPLSSHGEAATLEARAGECVARLGGNDAFWKYSNDLFEYTDTNGRGLRKGQTIYSLAADQGIEKNKLKDCLTDPAIQARIDANLESARKLGITGTPTTIVRNNKSGAVEIVSGAAQAKQLEDAINKVRQEAAAP